MPLNNLIEFDKVACLEHLKNVEDEELWNIFLDGQTKLFFNSEVQWIAKELWWQESERILEIGSGSGAYLSNLSNKFQGKTFQGIEKLPMFVNRANELYARCKLTFREGDAEIFDTQLISTADIVIFRWTLQHLKDSITALKNASHYISSNGYVLIIDSCDRAIRTSHPISAIDEALQLVAERQQKNGKGNRKVTLELLHTLESKKPPLGELYEIVFSNLDDAGNILVESYRLEGALNRRLYFNHSLLLLTIFHRIYEIPIDFDKAYNELKDYLEDEEAWTSLGMHFLVLRKK